MTPTVAWSPPDLAGHVAVVTGASKGVGRGIAEVLAECGAKTYLVARTLSALEDVANGIRADGGTAVVVACDLADDDAIEALFARVRDEDGHLEILVNNAVAWDLGVGDGEIAPFMYEPPWRAPPEWWAANFDVGVRSHWSVSNSAAPLFVEGRRGAVFFTSERQPTEAGSQELVLDLRATVVERMAALYALHLAPHQVASVLLYPGFTRTHAIHGAFERGGGYFDGWSEADFHDRTASIHYAGRAVAMLAADPDLMTRTGQLVTAHDAAVEYGFTDTSGAIPNPI